MYGFGAPRTTGFDGFSHQTFGVQADPVGGLEAVERRSPLGVLALPTTPLKAGDSRIVAGGASRHGAAARVAGPPTIEPHGAATAVAGI